MIGFGKPPVAGRETGTGTGLVFGRFSQPLFYGIDPLLIRIATYDVLASYIPSIKDACPLAETRQLDA